jgi:hypothetical protein
MEVVTVTIVLRDKPSQIDWPFLTFWLTYFSMILGFGYAIL